ncbi:hypothetical protein GGTG_03753 [Gaeumannomyces tritici R3-111a-1]|uniref:Uncharacterized protein n=1 Tax=Gaeumannomyces tritici (strain R3-111a-1) TaxID=644352 RepID=J3NR48_GAET3|nr:hypothetical protein GGTG_03753 [Gaeumannomyces tritici R3-111a-1]EJT78654.1 hypothetical protein GGTG_03753 [Gaeumannomyces tritici R3-111a-1]
MRIILYSSRWFGVPPDLERKRGAGDAKDKDEEHDAVQAKSVRPRLPQGDGKKTVAPQAGRKRRRGKVGSRNEEWKDTGGKERNIGWEKEGAEVSSRAISIQPLGGQAARLVILPEENPVSADGRLRELVES